MATQTVRNGAALLLGCLLVVLSACGEDLTDGSTSTSEATGSTTTAAEATDVESARALWDAEGPESYELTYEKMCYCASVGPVTVTVESGEITDVAAPEADDEAEATEDALSVEDLLDKAADAEADADVAEIEYDEEYGYPTLLDIDWLEDAVDDEVTYTVTSFESLD